MSIHSGEVGVACSLEYRRAGGRVRLLLARSERMVRFATLSTGPVTVNFGGTSGETLSEESGYENKELTLVCWSSLPQCDMEERKHMEPSRLPFYPTPNEAATTKESQWI